MDGMLAGMAQWIERQPANRRVVGSVPSQGTWLGFGKQDSCVCGPLQGAQLAWNAATIHCDRLTQRLPLGEFPQEGGTRAPAVQGCPGRTGCRHTLGHL